MARDLIISAAAVRDIKAAREWLKQSGSGANAAARLAHLSAAIKELR
jgi:plasmid stabilization system protein ParE